MAFDSRLPFVEVSVTAFRFYVSSKLNILLPGHRIQMIYIVCLYLIKEINLSSLAIKPQKHTCAYFRRRIRSFEGAKHINRLSADVESRGRSGNNIQSLLYWRLITHTTPYTFSIFIVII